MGKKPTRGVLLVQLGTPDSPKRGDLHRYLTEFLMDPRVMDIPYINRTLLVKGVIVPRRAPRSAAVYKSIWSAETGSPLMHYSLLQRDLLQQELGDDYHVELAMRYQNPSIAAALQKMEGMFLESIRVIPLFPQYASATTGSVIEKVMETMRHWTYFPALSFVSSYCDDEGVIETFAAHGRKYDIAQYDHVLFSFHGLPVRQLGKVDPSGKLKCPDSGCPDCQTEKKPHCYLSQCYATTRALVAELGLEEERYSVCFQSRLGKTPWIQPYTSVMLRDLALNGKKKLLVFSPTFVADCLETLEEIQVEYARAFKIWGGERVDLVESLNDDRRWIAVLKRLSMDN